MDNEGFYTWQVDQAERRIRKAVPAKEWILDSGAFREIEQFGGYRHEPEEYATEVNRLATINPGLIAAVSQDYMCEAMALTEPRIANLS